MEVIGPRYLRGKSPQYALDRRLGKLHSPSGRCGVKEDPLPLLRIQPQFLDGRARSPTLYQLNNPDSVKISLDEAQIVKENCRFLRQIIGNLYEETLRAKELQMK